MRGTESNRLACTTNHESAFHGKNRRGLEYPPTLNQLLQRDRLAFMQFVLVQFTIDLIGDLGSFDPMDQYMAVLTLQSGPGLVDTWYADYHHDDENHKT